MKFTKETLEINGFDYHVQRWGDENLPRLFLLHGWLDCGLTFQFLAENLAEQYHLIAPDWRGFGHSSHSLEGYWFPNYFADLDTLLAYYSEHEPANIVGHSMGGIVSLGYAGICPQRVETVLAIEGLGINETKPEQARERYIRWLSQLRDQEPVKTYENLDVIIKRIKTNNPRMTASRAEFVAKAWTRYLPEEKAYALLADMKHRRVNPILYRHEEYKTLWQNISANVYMAYGEESGIYHDYIKSGRLEDAQQNIDIRQSFVIKESGHMIHHDQPERLADIVKQVFA